MSKRKIQRIFTGEILEKPIRTYYRHLALKRGKLKATINSINTDNTRLNEINPIISQSVECVSNDQEINNIDSLTNSNEFFRYENRNLIDDHSIRNFFHLDKDEQMKYMSISLLSLFFAGNFTQVGLQLIVSHLQNFIEFKIPKTFDQMLNRVQGRSLEYEKIWFCQTCNTEVKLENYYQRDCSSCEEKPKYIDS
jgi:hypothetical protein